MKINDSLPEISVIIPVYNERERLRHNLTSLVTQESAPSYEIIYVDDCSTDGSWEELLRLAEGIQTVRLHRLERRKSVGEVRRTAVQLSRGKIIANMDADCIAPREWLRHSRLLKDNVGVIGFPVLPPPDLEYLHSRFDYLGPGQYSPGQLPHGCGALIRKKLVLAAGNFTDARLGEDTRLFEKIKETGTEIILIERPAIKLLSKRKTLRDHLARYYFMGQNANRKSGAIYAAMLIAVTTMLVTATMILNSSIPVSMLLYGLSGGVLANPKRVSYYVRVFRLPASPLARSALFSFIKLLETCSLIAGYVSSIPRRFFLFLGL